MQKKNFYLTLTLVITSTIFLGAVFIPLATLSNNASEYSERSKTVGKHTVKFDTGGGSKIESIQVEHGKKIQRPKDPTKKGYQALNWMRPNNKAWNFNSDIVVSDITLHLNWKLLNYSIKYNLNGGSTDQQLITSYTVNDSLTLCRPSKNDNVFVGWFNQKGERMDCIKSGSIGNLVLNAAWVDHLILFSEDNEKGNVIAYKNDKNENLVTVKNLPIEAKHHLFKGWYDADNNLISEDEEYTFELPTDISMQIHSKYLNDAEEKDWNDAHGVNPIKIDSSIRYGMYPQSVVGEDSLISILDNLSPSTFNNYIYYRSEYYCKNKAKLFKEYGGELPTSKEFDNGQEIVPDDYYWFKVEPITWKAIELESSIELVSDKLLGVQKFYTINRTRIIDGETIQPNNYKYSSLREWLNGDFYNKAFALNNSPIVNTNVDNSLATTDLRKSSENRFCCDNTFDKVFAPSYSECDSKVFDKQARTTDFCRAQGVRYGTLSSDLYCGYYFTRSPYDDPDHPEGYYVSRCNKTGNLNYDVFNESSTAVRPLICISK